MIKNIAKQIKTHQIPLQTTKLEILRGRAFLLQICNMPYPPPITARINSYKIKKVSKICISQINMETQILFKTVKPRFSIRRAVKLQIPQLPSNQPRVIPLRHILGMGLLINNKPNLLNKTYNSLLLLIIKSPPLSNQIIKQQKIKTQKLRIIPTLIKTLRPTVNL